MALGDVVDNLVMVDALLRVAGAPASVDVERLLSKVTGKVRVVIDCSADREGRLCKYVKVLLKGYESVDVVEGRVEKPKLNHELPPPSIAVEGVLGGRYRFHGLPEELLAPPFLLAIAAGGGAWRPESCPRSCKSCNLILYVVPGIPCAKAMVMIAEFLTCCKEASVDIINVDTLALLGKSLPVSRVPAFYSGGRLHVGLPRDLDSIVKLCSAGE